jgi:hypothetical protein
MSSLTGWGVDRKVTAKERRKWNLSVRLLGGEEKKAWRIERKKKVVEELKGVTEWSRRGLVGGGRGWIACSVGTQVRSGGDLGLGEGEGGGRGRGRGRGGREVWQQGSCAEQKPNRFNNHFRQFTIKLYTSFKFFRKRGNPLQGNRVAQHEARDWHCSWGELEAFRASSS